MTKFKIKNAPFEGPIIISPEELTDSRSYLLDTASTDDHKEMGIEAEFVQQSVEEYPRGVLRGLHFTRKNPQGKLVGVTRGSILDVVVDLRPESKTFGASYAVELSSENQQMIYIPPYYAHGFLTLEANTEVVVNYTEEHSNDKESGIIWDDEILMIDWKFERYDIDAKRLNMTAKDRKLPSFRSYNTHDLWPNRVIKRSYALKRLLNQRD